MYQTGGTIKKTTIKKTLEKIHSKNFVLPAIQREFVWKPEQICKFFDSLMQGYPFGTFLYWRVAAEKVREFKFYELMRNYHERDNPRCTQMEDIPNRPLTAVLDGQQRLTALNIGLRGTMTWKLPRKRWKSPGAFPERKLHLDLLSGSEPDENGIRYIFAFLTDEQSGQQSEDHCWYPVDSILKSHEYPDLQEWVNERLDQSKVNHAFRILARLRDVVHTHKLVAFYKEKEQNLEKVLNIFIRMNSGGTVLSYSDLLLSVAVAQWDQYDARDEINNLVGEMNDIGNGFNFSKDLVLKAGLMLSDIGNVGFKVENFNKKNMATLEDKWQSIKEALLLTAQILSDFGFNAQTIRADSAILPIACYLHQRKFGESYLTHKSHDDDRKNIREWFIKSLLKSGIWGSGLDTLLAALRDTIREHGTSHFPYHEIREVMAPRGKSISFEPEEIDELADMSYGDKNLFALMSLLFPFIKRGHIFHMDHIFPKGRFTDSNLQKASMPEDEIEQIKENANRIANLQLLDGTENKEKHATMPLHWITEKYPEENGRQSHMHLHLLDGLSDNLADFPAFYDRRREAIKKRIAEILNPARR